MSKQLSLSERIFIERMVANHHSFNEIGNKLNRSPSTIAREVKNYRAFVERCSHKGDNDCIYYLSCTRFRLCNSEHSNDCYGYRCKLCPYGIVCQDYCPQYISSHCKDLDSPPYVCNSCPTQKQQNCKKNHAYYTAHRADAAHHKAIKLAHSGIRKTPDELRKIGELIKPLIEKGQSLNHICTTHADELNVSERSLYNYIDSNVFDVRNIDLPKKVVYKRRKERKVLTKLEYKYRQGRTIKDFASFLNENPGVNVVEMDTVKGSRTVGKVMLTMIFRRSSFMLIFLMPDGTQKSVINVFDYLTSLLGLNTFRKLFPVILTDNGVEFKDPCSLEHSKNGCQRTRIFYCDPQASWQKPMVENNHRFIRRIIPKGKPFTKLTEVHVKLITCHINSVLRENLDQKTPFDYMVSEEQKKLLLSLNLSSVPPDEVMLKPALLKDHY